MKKIINGKLYNTQTAKALASRDNHCQPGSFDYVEEILYRKKTGEFFLRGSGGARTIYSERIERGSRGSSRSRRTHRRGKDAGCPRRDQELVGRKEIT